MKYIPCTAIGLGLFLAMAGVPAGAQNQAPSNTQKTSSGSSLGDYARQIRKDPGAKTTPKVFDNDNLPRTDKLSVIGPAAGTTDTGTTSTVNSGEEKTAAPAGTSATAGETKAPAAAKASTEAKPAAEEKAPLKSTAPLSVDDEAVKQAGAKQWADKLAAQKDQIDLLTRELDVLQREYQIRAAAMYADAGNRLRNSGDWDKQDAQYKQQIADKQKAVEDAKQKLEDLQEEARKAEVPATVREQ
jgi:hypothetical protein